MNNNVRVFFSSLWEWLLSFGPFVALGVALMVGAYHWLDPNPPKQVVLATGPEQSAYDAMGQHYAKALSAYGIDVTLLPPEGSAHNLDLLRSGQADLAFVQGGSVAWADTDRQNLTALGNLFVEPLWVFYWQTSAQRLVGRPKLTQLRDRQGARHSQRPAVAAALFAVLVGQRGRTHVAGRGFDFGFGLATLAHLAAALHPARALQGVPLVRRIARD